MTRTWKSCEAIELSLDASTHVHRLSKRPENRISLYSSAALCYSKYLAAAVFCTKEMHIVYIFCTIEKDWKTLDT